MIKFYKEFNELGYLANYSNYGFTINGVYYKTVEHYYQAMKFDNEEIRERIINATTPKEASNIGRDRNNKRIKNFRDIKLEVMFNGILEKFRQNRNIAYKLIETRNKDIAEATIDEYFWGIGKDKSGENNIGKILVQVRERIKREIIESIINKARNCDEVYVIGHYNPDADSVFSSYILSKVLQSFGINAKFGFLKDYKISGNDEKLIKDYLIEEPVIATKRKKFILVDHNNLNGLNENNVLGAFDHHIISAEVYDTLEMEYASTGLLIYDLFKDYYEFSKEEKELIALTVLADCDYLCSSRFSSEDKKIYNKLKVDLDVKELQKKYFVVTDLNKDIKEVFNDNYKEYNIAGKHICRSMIYSYTKDFKKYYKEYANYAKENGYLLIWCDFEKRRTRAFYDNKELNLDYILTSTNLIIKKFEK